jgi:hypothetical protein
MTASRDLDALLAAYLDDGPAELALDSYEAVDEAVRRTRQRTARGPWRTRPMIHPARAVVGVAAVVVASVVGISLLRTGPPGPSGGTGTASASPPAASASSSASPSASADGSAAVIAVPPTYRWPAQLRAGTYTTSFTWGESLQFTFTVPIGWDSLDINVVKNRRIALAFYPVTAVAPPTCGSPSPSGLDVLTADTALLQLGKLVTFAGAPVDAHVADRFARYVEFDARAPIGCQETGSVNVLFRTPTPICDPAVCSSVGPPTFGLEFGTDVTHHERLWLMNVGRGVVAMNAVWIDDATPTELAELQSIIDSVQLATPLATQAPQPAGTGG